MVDLIILVFYGMGAGMVWLLKGCRTSYFDELVQEQEMRNSLVAIVIFAFLFRLAIYINN